MNTRIKGCVFAGFVQPNQQVSRGSSSSSPFHLAVSERSPCNAQDVSSFNRSPRMVQMNAEFCPVLPNILRIGVAWEWIRGHFFSPKKSAATPGPISDALQAFLLKDLWGDCDGTAGGDVYVVMMWMVMMVERRW